VAKVDVFSTEQKKFRQEAWMGNQLPILFDCFPIF